MKPDIGAYYNQTQNHYQRWWHLNEAMALHYGLWDKETPNFKAALTNTNKYLAHLARVSANMQVLDAGCGVGGSAIFLAKNFAARVTGISLSELQVKTAVANAKKHQVNDLTRFELQDFTNTNFAEACFDLIWACESSSSAADKQVMAREWYRLLKPGGKVVIADFFKTEEEQTDPDNLLNTWSALWAMSPLVSATTLCRYLDEAGFSISSVDNLTDRVRKTVKRMYLSYWLGLVPSRLYNLLFGARPYARNHYKSGFIQYKARKKNLWQYQVILAEKPL